MSNKVNYSAMVAALAKPGQAILDTLTPYNCNLLHMAVGISGESGELLDAVKKVTVYNKAVNRENLIEELGDLEFYMEGLRQAINATREETLLHNIAKLRKRYMTGGYTDKQAQDRGDKA